MIQSGTLLGGRYRLVSRLGKGGMGEVWEAVQEGLGRRVAVKVLLPELVHEPELLARFQREAQAAASLGHPNIVQTTDFVSVPGEPPCLVMELLSGQSFARAIEGGPMGEARVAFIAMQLLEALAVAHRAGIVHRDIKPDNVFLTSIAGVDDIVRVLDFGIAKLYGETEAPKLTMTGAVMGTPQYMAPEQARGLAVDARTDLFAVGTCMYQALTGRLPFAGNSFNALLFAIAEEAAPPVASLRANVDPRLAAIVDRAMAKDPSQRFASADEMRGALAPFAAGSTASFAPAPLPTPAVAVTPSGAVATLPQAGQVQVVAPPKKRVWIVPLALFAVLAVGIGVPAALYASGAFDDPPPKAAKKAPVDVEADSPKPKKPTQEDDDKSEKVAAEDPPSKIEPSKSAEPSKVAKTKPTAAAPSTSTAPSTPPTPPPAPTGKPSKQTGGKTAYLSSASTNGLYEVAKLRAGAAPHAAAVNACYAPLEWDPVDHQFEQWSLSVDATGKVLSVGPVGTGARCAALDACMTKVFKAFALGPTTDGKSGTMNIGYTSRAPWNP